MPFWRFSVLTLAGCVPWVLMLTYIGKQAGDNWEDWKDSLHYVDYVVAAAIVIGVALPDRAPPARRAARRSGDPRPRRRAGAGGRRHRDRLAASTRPRQSLARERNRA